MLNEFAIAMVGKNHTAAYFRQPEEDDINWRDELTNKNDHVLLLLLLLILQRFQIVLAPFEPFTHICSVRSSNNKCIATVIENQCMRTN